MWTHEERLEIAATPERLWALLSDVPGWKQWNAGIAAIEIHGPFAPGTTFTMQPPGQDAFLSTLIEVEANAGFTKLVESAWELMGGGSMRSLYRWREEAGLPKRREN